MGIRNRNGKLEYRFHFLGRRHQVLTDLADTPRNRRTVEAMERDHRNRLALQKRQSQLPSYRRAFADAVEEFKEWCKVRYTQHPASGKRIMTSLASALVFFGSAPIGMIQAAHIEDYGMWRSREHDVRPVTLRNDYRALSVLFQWAVKHNYAPENPVASVKVPSAADAVRQHVVSQEEERRYFAVARGNVADVARLMLLQGLRPGGGSPSQSRFQRRLHHRERRQDTQCAPATVAVG